MANLPVMVTTAVIVTIETENWDKMVKILKEHHNYFLL